MTPYQHIIQQQHDLIHLITRDFVILVLYIFLLFVMLLVNIWASGRHR